MDSLPLDELLFPNILVQTNLAPSMFALVGSTVGINEKPFSSLEDVLIDDAVCLVKVVYQQ